MFASTTRMRGWVLQALLLLVVGGLCFELFLNALDNLQHQHIATGFGFLNTTAGFSISQTPIPYTEQSSYGRVLLVGLANTLIVSILGVILATVIGFVVGVSRLSRNWLVARLAGGYVEIIRNIPLLLQLFFWYTAVISNLSGPEKSFSLFDAAFLNSRGFFVPHPSLLPAATPMLYALGFWLICLVPLFVWPRRRQDAAGRRRAIVLPALALLIGLVGLVCLSSGAPLAWSYPELAAFNFRGGMRVVPEFVALLLALSLYTAAFIAEIVRGGILAINRGQTEAAAAIGLTRFQTLRLIVLPLALRVMVPPLTNQYLNLLKNSSLAVAIAYPDLVAVFAGTVLNQTGQAIEVLAITMGIYLGLSLLTAGFMSRYNKRLALIER